MGELTRWGWDEVNAQAADEAAADKAAADKAAINDDDAADEDEDEVLIGGINTTGGTKKSSVRFSISIESAYTTFIRVQQVK